MSRPPPPRLKLQVFAHVLAQPLLLMLSIQPLLSSSMATSHMTPPFLPSAGWPHMRYVVYVAHDTSVVAIQAKAASSEEVGSLA